MVSDCHHNISNNYRVTPRPTRSTVSGPVSTYYGQDKYLINIIYIVYLASYLKQLLSVHPDKWQWRTVQEKWRLSILVHKM